MNPQKLLALATSLDISQADIARHLGIGRTKVVRWATGKRPIPTKYREAVWEFIREAFHRRLAAGKSQQRGLTAGWIAPQVEQIFHAVTELGIEHAELHGEGPTAQIASVRMALNALPDDPKELRKPANTLRLLELCEQLTDASILLAKIGPLQDELEERNDANDTK